MIRKLSQLWRAMGAGGIFGGVVAILAYAGVLGEDGTGDVSLLVLGFVFLAIGIPSFIVWLKTF